jgi:CxxC-x17-CxxC domain-containing protein
MAAALIAEQAASTIRWHDPPPRSACPGTCLNLSAPANRIKMSSPHDMGPDSPDQVRPIIDRRFAVRRRISFPFYGRSGMEFVDRLLTCADCGGEFIFTAGEQLFFLDKQFKNDPKRCKPCKSRRSAQTVSPTGGPAAAGISRTETRTECSDCGVVTTVPFKPTQGRPVLCRQCFKNKRPPTETVVATVNAVAEIVASVPAAELGQGSAELGVTAHSAQA